VIDELDAVNLQLDNTKKELKKEQWTASMFHERFQDADIELKRQERAMASPSSCPIYHRAHLVNRVS